MKQLMLISLALSFLLANISDGFAEKWRVSKNGTAAMPFLKIGVGARAIGLGETFAAMANDAASLYWNPAGSAQSTGYHLHFSHNQWIADLQHDYLAATMPFRRGTLGLQLITLNSDLIEITTLEQPNGTGLFYDFSDMALGLSYSFYIIENFAVGITAKYLREKNYNEAATALAVDVGTLLHTGFHGLKIGMCFSNFGTDTHYEGTDLGVPYTATLGDAEGPSNAQDVEASLVTKAYHLPTNFRVGFAIDLLGGEPAFFQVPFTRMTLLSDLNYPNDGDQKINLGAEIAIQERFFIRTGYRFNYTHELPTFGGGLLLGTSEKRLCIDYAFADFGDLAEVHRFSIEFGF